MVHRLYELFLICFTRPTSERSGRPSSLGHFAMSWLPFGQNSLVFSCVEGVEFSEQMGEEITIQDALVFVHSLGAEAYQTESKMYDCKT